MLEKTYQPADIEARIHADWMKAQAFKAGRPERAKAASYCIVIPPPNVTGSLHIGHALNNTLQDMLVPLRAHARQGRAVAAGHRPRRHRHADGGRAPARRSASSRTAATMGREEFVEKVWEWKAEIAAAPSSTSCAASAPRATGARERFTMDEGLSTAVRKVFVELYKRGADLQGQAAGQLGPAVPDRDLRPRGRAAARSKGNSGTSPIRSEDGSGEIVGRDDAARDHAGRHGRRRASRRRALQGT